MKYFNFFFLIGFSLSTIYAQSSSEKETQHFRFFNQSTALRKSGVLKVDAKEVQKAFVLAPQKISFELKDMNGVTLPFELEKYKLFSDDLMIQLSSGERIMPDKALFYRGIIKGEESSLITITLNEKGFNLLYSHSKGNYEITKSENNTYFYRSINESPVGNSHCITEDDSREQDEHIGDTRVSYADCIELYVECDYKSFQDNGSNVTNTQNWMNNIFNNVATIYQNAKAPIIITQFTIWNTPDIYTSATSAFQMRSLFVQRLIGLGFSGKIAYLLSTRPLGGGISYGIGGYCKSITSYPGPCALSTGLSLTNQSYPTYSASVHNVAHELGHVMGLKHSHACAWNGNDSQVDDCGNVIAFNNDQTPEGENCFNSASPILPGSNGTIMSRCDQLPGQAVSFATGFGTVIKQKLFSNFTNAPCITGASCSTIPPPNDECIDAITLTLSQTCNIIKTYDNDYGTESSQTPIYPCIAPQVYTTDVWFKAVIPSSGGLTIETKQVSGGFADMLLQAFSGTCSTYTSIACDDDSGDALHAKIVLTGRTPGETIYFRAAPKDDKTMLDYGEFGICAYDASVPCHPDKDALVSIYNAMGGPNWTIKTGWVNNSTNCDVCTWYGVVCDEESRVTALNLGFNNLTGSLPTAITNLTKLTRLNLYSNNLSGSLPNMLNSLPLLHYIDMADNNFTGSIPSSFNSISNLRSLYLDDNNLSGSLPAGLTNADLETLWLNTNNFSGCIPSSYTVFCTRNANVRLENNALLPGGGNYNDFCDDGFGGDADNDGYCAGSQDCNDQSNLTYPGAAEICDGNDNDCDMQVDENIPDVTNTWLVSSGNWNNPANWSAGIVPKSCHDAVINPGSAAIITISNGTFATASSVTVGQNATLLLQYNAFLNLQDKGELVNSGIINIYGELTIDNPQDSLGVSLTNSNLISVFSTGKITMSDCGQSCLRNNNTATISNEGIIQMHTNAVNGLYGINNLGIFNNNGTVTVENIYGKEIRIALGSVFDCNLGSVVEVR